MIFLLLELERGHLFHHYFIVGNMIFSRPALELPIVWSCSSMPIWLFARWLVNVCGLHWWDRVALDALRRYLTLNGYATKTYRYSATAFASPPRYDDVLTIAVVTHELSWGGNIIVQWIDVCFECGRLDGSLYHFPMDWPAEWRISQCNRMQLMNSRVPFSKKPS